MSGACPVLSVTIVVLEPKEDSKATVSPSEKRGPSSEQPWGYTLRGEGGGELPLPRPGAAGRGYETTRGLQSGSVLTCTGK